MPLIYSVEDDENIAELIRTALKAAGHSVETFDNYTPFAEAVEQKKPDLILLDVMLPGKNGIEIISILKREEKTREIPVIFLSAKGAELDRVAGLESGADDYIPKPFGVLELLARVKAALRHRNAQPVPDAEKDGLVVDKSARRVLVDGEDIRLTFIEYELLFYMYRNRGLAISRDKLLCEVWGYDYDGDTTRTVDMHIRALRQKLGDSADEPKYIETVRGYGYRMK